MAVQPTKSQGVRWLYIIVAVVVLAGLGYWLTARYSPEPLSETVVPGSQTGNTTAAPGTATPQN